MDSQLKEAACTGDINFLTKAFDSKPTDYFLTSFTPEYGDDPTLAGNILHLAMLKNQEAFVRVVVQTLPASTLHILISRQESSESIQNWNPLHFAACIGNHYIVDLFLGLFKSSPDTKIKPWLAIASNGETPLHVAIRYNNENSARNILLMDKELLCTMVDYQGNSPLFLAVEKGYNGLALEIMESSELYSVSCRDELTPLHVLQVYLSDPVLKKLLSDHPELIYKSDRTNKFTVLHSWAKDDQSYLLQQMAENGISCFRNLTSLVDNDGNTPMHVALLHGQHYFAQKLVNLDKSPLESILLPAPAWVVKNKDGNMPFHLALNSSDDSFTPDVIKRDPRVCYDYNPLGESPLFLAVKKGRDKIVRQILELTDYDVTRGSPQRHTDGQTVLHVASNCQEDTCNMLIKKFLWLINEPDKEGKRPIDVASEVGTSWLVKLLLTKDPYAITYSPKAWTVACKKGHVAVVTAFIDHCQEFRKVCLEQQDTPLHHIKLEGYKDYEEFLAIPLIQEMLNARDSYGRTPLHLALEREDKIFAEVLLTTKGVEQSMKDKDQKTAMDLLKDLCDHNDEWASMCKRIEINPWIKTTYIQDISSLGDVRQTLSVVAALLATLTFTAGFTLPGGLNQDTGEAILVKEASFLVFILADAYAMGCSMLVMFCLIWSMICQQDKALPLIDRSVVILLHSLYGTLVAFMTGVYTVIHNKSLWAAILVVVMCSIVAISANRSILYFLFDNLIPSMDKGRKYSSKRNEHRSNHASETGHNICINWRSQLSEP